MNILDHLESRMAENTVGPILALSRAEQLEIASHLVSGASSLEELQNNPGDYSAVSSLPIDVILRRIQTVEHMVASEPSDLEPADEPKEYCRYPRWQRIAAFWCEILELDSEDTNPFLTLLASSPDVGRLNLPGALSSDGSLTSCLDSDQIPDEQKISWILAHWLAQWNEKDPTLLGHWERLRDIALAHQCSLDVAELYRSACRETYNHSWSLPASIGLGIYDYPVERGSFFNGKGGTAEVEERIKHIWKWEEPEAMD